MRELEREIAPDTHRALPISIVGRGRVGASLAAAAERAGVAARLVATSEAAEAAAGTDAVLLCVPDGAIAGACEAVASSRIPPARIGHVSGAATLESLAAGTGRGIPAFSMHPLQTFPDERTAIEGAPCAIAGSDPESLEFAAGLAERLGMRPFEVPDDRRAAYHAAATIASNFLVTLEESASELLERAGVEDARELLSPLVLRTAANWAEQGPAALTGPIARGDTETVERHRAALSELAPELLSAYEALAERTEAVASQGVER